MAVAFTFPGQGSQTIGMGRELAEVFPDSRAAFAEVDEGAGQKLPDRQGGGLLRGDMQRSGNDRQYRLAIVDVGDGYASHHRHHYDLPATGDRKNAGVWRHSVMPQHWNTAPRIT